MYKPNFKNTEPVEYILNDYTKGYAQCIDNNWNYAVYAQDPSVSIYQNEYNAGYVQGKVQGNALIKATRNNTWKWYMLDEGPGANTTDIPPHGLEIAGNCLVKNYNWLTDWAEKTQTDEKTRGIIRLMYRMLGIFEGAANKEPRKEVKFDDLKLANMSDYDKVMHSGDDELSFIDVYFINAQMDLFDAIGAEIDVDIKRLEQEIAAGIVQDGSRNLRYRPDHCSGFVKYMPDGEIYWCHTSWCCVFSQTCAMTYVIGSDFITQNQFCPGQFGSNTDFGFNGHGIGFNETTETYFIVKPKVEGIFLTWRSSAAEHYSKSVEEFYDYLKMDNTGTYLSAYMVVDAYKGEFGMIDMSYERFALFKSDGSKLSVVDSTGYEPNFLDWDHHMVTESYVLGCNYPIYKRIFRELKTIDGAPKRRYQLFRNIPNVNNMEDVKALITFNSSQEPISIAGRWDLGYGTSEFIRYQPHAAIDGKAFSTEEIKKVLASLSMKPCKNGQQTSFWMKYGTPYIDGKPFVWSLSKWAKFKDPEEVDFIPDAIDGRWNKVKMFME